MRTGLLYALALLLLLGIGRATASADVLADVPPTFSVEAAAAGAEPATAAAFTIKLSAPVDSTTSVRISTAPADGADAAIAGADYAPVKDVLVQVPKGHTAAKAEVRVVDDQLDEWPEKFLVTLSDASSGTRIDAALRTATGSIQDNDVPPVAKLANAPDVTEGNSAGARAVFTVSLSRTSGRDVRVAFATGDGTAKAGEDYVARSGVLRIPAGDLGGNVPVDLVADRRNENTESFTLEIARHDETAVMGAPTEVSVKILDDDAPGTPAPIPASLSIADATADEPSGQGVTVTFRVTLTPAVTRPVTVNWATADGTAGAGKDYAAGGGTLSFAAGETTKNVAVGLLADDQAESNETFVVNLSSPVGATLADAQALGTIVEKGAVPPPPPPPTSPVSLSITDELARESEGARFTVQLSSAASSRVTVTVSTSDGTAREGLDYLGRRSTIEFAPGERTKTLAVTVIDDDLTEPDETFSVGLGNAINAVIAKNRGIATIESNDLAAVARPEAIPSNTLPVTVKPRVDTGRTAKNVTIPDSRLPQMALWPLVVKVDPRGVARMTVACLKRSPVRCSGRVALETVAKSKFKLADRSFVVRKGKQASLPLKLGLRGRTLLAREGKVRARVIVFIRVGSLLLRVQPGVITLDSIAAAGSSPRRP